MRILREIKGIFDMDVDDFHIKAGDVKVDSEELRTLLRYLQQYHSILGNVIDQLDPEKQEIYNKGVSFTEYFQNKYIVLAELRQEQKLYYDILQKFKDKDYIKGYSQDEIDNYKRLAWEQYIEAKDKRETLQKELDQIKGQIG